MNAYYFTHFKREKAAEKIQAAVKGHCVRKIFYSVRKEFENIVESIDGEGFEVKWTSKVYAQPIIKNLKVIQRLKEIKGIEEKLADELREVRLSIQERKRYLKACASPIKP